MADLKTSKTLENLKAAFAGESQANRRYLYFANKADVEGQNDLAFATDDGVVIQINGSCDPALDIPLGDLAGRNGLGVLFDKQRAGRIEPRTSRTPSGWCARPERRSSTMA